MCFILIIAWQAFFCDYFKDNAAIQQIDWDTWYYAPGKCSPF